MEIWQKIKDMVLEGKLKKKLRNTSFATGEKDVDNALNEMIATLNTGSDSTRYNYTRVDMETVFKNPDEYIIPELLEACKKLWQNNVFTFMCSNRNDSGNSYIQLEKLSDENQIKLEKLVKSHPENFFYSDLKNRGEIFFDTRNFHPEKDPEDTKKISELFCKAVDTLDFSPQDIQSDYYLTVEQFLMECGYRIQKFVKNPDYNPKSKFGGDTLEKSESVSKVHTPKTVKISVFDKDRFEKDNMKMDGKALRYYLEQKGKTQLFDEQALRIYNSEFYFERHQKYLEYDRLMSKTCEPEEYHS